MEMNKDIVIILKNAGTSCNIGCTYCAEERKKFISVEKFVTLEDIKKLLACCDNKMPMTMLFHGGEPTLLPIDYYESIIEYCMSVRDDILFGLQTNATLLNTKWIEFILKHRDHMGVSISLDGTSAMNAYRKDKKGNETFDIVKSNLKVLENNNIETGIISTLTNIALGHEEDLIDLIREFSNIRFVKLNPCFDLWDTGEIPRWGITPLEYSQFVTNFFDLMISKKLFGRVDVEPILSIMKNIENLGSSFCNYSNKKCNHFISLYPDGVLTSCDNYDTKEGYLGSLYEIKKISDVSNFQQNLDLNNDIDSLIKECDKCPYKKICKGGCLAVRRRYKKYYKGEEQNMYCIAMANTIDHIKNCIKILRGEL